MSVRSDGLRPKSDESRLLQWWIRRKLKCADDVGGYLVTPDRRPSMTGRDRALVVVLVVMLAALIALLCNLKAQGWQALQPPAPVVVSPDCGHHRQPLPTPSNTPVVIACCSDSGWPAICERATSLVATPLGLSGPRSA